MRVLITAESHNQVNWEIQTPVVRIELGLLAGWGLFAALIGISPSPLKWVLVGGVGFVILGVAALLALTTPVAEFGCLERTPEGGDVRRSKRWLLSGERVAWMSPLESVTGFRVETRTFEEVGDQTYTLARLWVMPAEGAPALLTGWSEQQQVTSLGESLAKAGRLTYELEGTPPVA